MQTVHIRHIQIGAHKPLAVIAGPCVIESEELAFFAAEQLKAIFSSLQIPFIYKSSYDKANRSSKNSFRGVGIKKGLDILGRISEKFSIPVTSDVHTVEEITQAAEVCDILQIPAFLCRQTDLIVAAGETGKVVNVKKGQFLAPWDMKNVVEKLQSTGNNQIILTERGTSFGYNNLVVDMRALPIMQQLGYPVCFDATHALQLPGGLGSETGGQRQFIPHLAKAAIAAGANCLFIEAHPHPKEAKSDKETVLAFEDLIPLFQELKKIYNIVQKQERGASCSADGQL